MFVLHKLFANFEENVSRFEIIKKNYLRRMWGLSTHLILVEGLEVTEVSDLSVHSEKDCVAMTKNTRSSYKGKVAIMANSNTFYGTNLRGVCVF